MKEGRGPYIIDACGDGWSCRGAPFRDGLSYTALHKSPQYQNFTEGSSFIRVGLVYTKDLTTHPRWEQMIFPLNYTLMVRQAQPQLHLKQAKGTGWG